MLLLRNGIGAFRRRWTAEGGYGEFLVIAGPLILMTSSWSIQQFVNRIFLTWHSKEALDASTPAAILNMALMSFFMGTVTYAETFVAQYYGAKRYQRIGPSFWQGIYVAIIGGIVLLIAAPFAKPIFHFVGHAPAVQHNEVVFFQILCLGAMPALASMAMAGFFAGRGETWPVMWVNFLGMAVNIVLDYLLIFGKFGFPEWGIKGAGIATVSANVVEALVYMALLAKPSHERKYHTLSGWRFDAGLFGRLLRFGAPSGIQFFIDLGAFAVFLLFVGRLGEDPQAATNIAFSINTVAFMPMLGSGFAVSILVGQYLGRDRPGVAQKAAYSGFHLTFAYMAVIAALYVLAPQLFLAPFAANADPKTFPAIAALTVILLRFVAVYSIFDTMNIIFSSAIKGAGDTRFVMLMIIVLSTFALVIPTFVAVVLLHENLYVAWTIASIYFSLLGFAFLFRFLGGKWKRMRVIEPAPPMES